MNSIERGRRRLVRALLRHWTHAIEQTDTRPAARPDEDIHLVAARDFSTHTGCPLPSAKRYFTITRWHAQVDELSRAAPEAPIAAVRGHWIPGPQGTLPGATRIKAGAAVLASVRRMQLLTRLRTRLQPSQPPGQLLT